MKERHLIVKREIRRDKVLELYSQGYSQAEIARLLSIGIASVHRIISFFRTQAAASMINYYEDRFPEEFSKVLVSLNAIQKETWSILSQSPDTKGRVQALGVAIECATKKLQLLANPTIIDNVKRYISNHADDFTNSKATTTEQNGYAKLTKVDSENGVF